MDVTVVIPTKNGGELLNRVLDMIFRQKTKYEYEVICVDSGSSDETVEVIKKYPCKLFEIKPEEFGHGKTRNFGASKGTGEFIMFLTQDALPANEYWMENFITAMKKDDDIAGGFGRHLPYPDCNILDKRDLKVHFENFGVQDTVFQMDNLRRYQNEEGYRHFLVFYSDNNSCMRRKFWEQYPYDDVDFAEDQIWARKMIEKGYKKLYCADAVVYHSHNYPLNTYFGRFYDEYKSLYKLHRYQMYTGFFEMLSGVWRQTQNDYLYIENECVGNERKIWKKYARRRNLYRGVAGYMAGGYYSYPESVQEFLDRHISQQYKQIKGKDY